MRPAALAPASVAALTAATSPVTKAETRPLPTLSQPRNCTFAAFIIASVASTRAMKPLVSIMPSASIAFAIVENLQEEGKKFSVFSIQFSVFSIQLKLNTLFVFHLASARLFLQQLDVRGRIQVTGVAFVGVDVDLQLACLVGPYK